ncbi:MAG: DUF362 domain-containing protein, partial [Thermodesulfobacteriota bacterium]
WVLHYNKSNQGMDCMVTHPCFIETVLKEVLKAKPRRVIIGDAPIQECDFQALVSQKWIDKVKAIAHPTRLDVVDFRRKICRVSKWSFKVDQGLKDMSSFILFDLASKSLLDPISLSTGQFRVTNYDPDELIKTHRPGLHQYLLCREVFEADIIINLPKLKTHHKAGVTAALKNMVGINGEKDYLPHHRLGGSVHGGDCYEGNKPLKRFAEYFMDNANRRINKATYFAWQKGASFCLRLNRILFGEDDLTGGWYGNDTVWRMVLDLNRILVYGRSDASLSLSPLRRIYSLTDGIIAGERMGPLTPEPVNLGAVTFASSSAFADLLHTALMHFDWRKIPLVKSAFHKFSYQITRYDPAEIQVHVQGNKLSLEHVAATFGQNFKPPNGWEGHIEMD